VILIGAGALVIDVGSWFKEKRNAQSVADATALGAVQDLPASAAWTVDGDVAAIRSANNWDGSITTSLSGTYTAGDTITAQASIQAPSFFAEVFGIKTQKIGASATAVIASYTGFGNAVMPWAVLPTDPSNPSNYTTPFTIKAGSGSKLNSGEYGAVDLSVLNGNSCSLDSGSNPYRDTIAGAIQVCETKVGDVVSTENGSMTGPTSQGLSDRTVNGQHVINPFDPSSILTTNPLTGQQELTTINHPNVVLIPIINTWPGGKKPVTITGFAWFVITSYNGATVNGIFVHSATAPSGLNCYEADGSQKTCSLGAYDPTGDATSGTRVIMLIK
jgi:hypothetical protein